MEADTRVQRSGRAAWAPAGPNLDRVLILALAIGTASTMLVLLPGVHGHASVPAIDLVIDTVALVACMTFTALAWARFRESHVVTRLYHAGAFLALAAAYGIAVFVSLITAESIGSLAEPEDVQVLVFAVAQLAAACLFVIAGDLHAGGRPTDGTPADPGRPRLLAVISAYVIGPSGGSSAGRAPDRRVARRVRTPEHARRSAPSVHLVTASAVLPGGLRQPRPVAGRPRRHRRLDRRRARVRRASRSSTGRSIRAPIPARSRPGTCSGSRAR